MAPISIHVEGHLNLVPGERRRARVARCGIYLLTIVLLAGCAGREPADSDNERPQQSGSDLEGGAVTESQSGSARDAEVEWVPSVGQPWQWQLSGELDLSVDVPVYDLDWQTTSAETVAELHDQGRRVICYLSVGTWESYRPDADDYPESVRGKTLADWPDERWVDVRRLDVLGPLLQARLDVCRAKGFDAVEPDNVDAYSNDSGFPLTPEDQLTFNRWVAGEARSRGMAVGLKNDVAQVPELVDDFDFAVNEECMEYQECDRLQPFLDAGKAVLHVEYGVTAAEFQAMDVPAGFSSMLKNRDLDAFRVTRSAGLRPSE